MAKTTTKRARRHRRHPTGTCEVKGCNRPHRRRGMCGMHVMRWVREGSPGEALPRAGFGHDAAPHEDRATMRRLARLAADGGPFAVVYTSQCRARAKVGTRSVSIGVAELNALETRRWVRVTGRDGDATTFIVTDKGRSALAPARAAVK